MTSPGLVPPIPCIEQFKTPALSGEGQFRRKDMWRCVDSISLNAMRNAPKNTHFWYIRLYSIAIIAGIAELQRAFVLDCASKHVSLY
ncbi:hypothetical protein FB567DRAFT_634029 [Paraphoma chrysanthemicola]|uniref:Uncharacterized protein n=1 Tax=Paraphoma chrysanthemicola TaxID=798071 RepID=A0A8K0VSW2_9PLEO|nr:hypothetical protein FB567DRAFT_634029 [Paraphoma chrysanthemicola]